MLYLRSLSFKKIFGITICIMILFKIYVDYTILYPINPIKMIKTLNYSNKWIVVTSINEPTKSISVLSNISSFQLLVIGDISSPTNWNYYNTIFLSIEEQNILFPRLSKIIPHKCYCRKIFGYLYAIQNGAKYIYDTDDDNSPLVDLNKHFHYNAYSYGLIANTNFSNNSDYMVMNPYAHFGQSSIWPRGYPLNRIKDKNRNLYFIGKRKTSLVQQGLVNGDPDVDAIYRLVYSHEKNSKFDIKFDDSASSFQLPERLFSPYNSQNTLFHYDAFWSLYLPHTVTFRVTDIWRSYWSQPLLWLINGTLEFHGPTAYQLRNPHSYLKDFNEEDDLYKKTDDLIKFLNKWKCKDRILIEKCVIQLSYDMANNNFWSKGDAESIKVWVETLKSIGYIFPSISYSKNKKIEELTGYKFSPNVPQTISINDYEKTIVENKNPQKIQYDILNEKCKDYKNEISQNLDLLLNNSRREKSVWNDITVLITFNRKVFPENIKLLFAMYYDYFQNMLFCGKDIITAIESMKLNQSNIYSYLSAIDLETINGYYHYDCLTKALQMNLKTRGVMLMSDDVLIKQWNMRNFDKDKIWYVTICNSKRFPCGNIDLPPSLPWWRWKDGRTPVRNFLKDFNSIKDPDIDVILENYKLVYEENTKSNFAKQNYSLFTQGGDIFYLPRRHFQSFIEIGKLFRKHVVFLEYAVPMILHGLDYLKNIEYLNDGYYWGTWFMYEDYDKFKHFTHPAKLSNVESKPSQRRLFCKNFVNDKIKNN